MNIEVSNCCDCMFSGYENSYSIYGKDICSLSEKVDEDPIYCGLYETLPSDSVHYRCPLKRLNKVTVKIKEV